MEREGGFNGYPNHPNANSGLNMNQPIHVNNNGNEQHYQIPRSAPAIVREQDQYMPIANVIRIMRRILPPYAKISDEAKEVVQECVSEYISFLTAEANDRCHHEQRKTVTAEDVIWAMGKLGFDNYVEPLSLYLSRYRENEGDRKEPVMRRGVLDYGHHGPNGNVGGPYYAPVYNMGFQYDPSMGGGYYRDGGSGSSGGSSSQANLSEFDPFSQFK